MDKDQLQARLKELELSKQDFSEICRVPYSTVTNWGVLREGKPMPVPHWVEPFLEYYEKAQKLEYVMREICSKIEAIKRS
jgi:predicted transcriptional regulator